MAKARLTRPQEFDDTTEAAPRAASVHDRSIGEILTELRQLDDGQVAQVLALQKDRGLRFGEAAVALGLARNEDVLWALSQQFHYPYAPESTRKLDPELVVATQPFSQRAEAFRAVRSQLTMRLGAPGEPRRALAIVSPDSGDGKTYFAANIATAFSQMGGRTLLVDGDLRNPRLHQLFGLPKGEGLSAILSGRAADNVIHNVAELPSLFVLPVGTVPPNPLELVERPAFAMLLRELLAKFDHVIVDTPAAVHGSDAAVIAAKCGSALAIARQGASRVAALQQLVGMLGETTARVAGVVVNEF